jgi:hypothetical protein
VITGGGKVIKQDIYFNLLFTNKCENKNIKTKPVFPIEPKAIFLLLFKKYDIYFKFIKHDLKIYYKNGYKISELKKKDMINLCMEFLTKKSLKKNIATDIMASDIPLGIAKKYNKNIENNYLNFNQQVNDNSFNKDEFIGYFSTRGKFLLDTKYVKVNDYNQLFLTILNLANYLKTQNKSLKDYIDNIHKNYGFNSQVIFELKTFEVNSYNKIQSIKKIGNHIILKFNKINENI